MFTKAIKQIYWLRSKAFADFPFGQISKYLKLDMLQKSKLALRLLTQAELEQPDTPTMQQLIMH